MRQILYLNNQVSDIVETEAGLHIIELTEVSRADIPSFESRKEDLEKELALSLAEPKFWGICRDLKRCFI